MFLWFIQPVLPEICWRPLLHSIRETAVKKFSFAQVNFQQGPKEYNSFYLPYTAGMVACYALSDISVSSKWQLDHLLYKRDDINQVVEKLKDQDCVALSTYVWNREWNYALGKALKNVNPNIIIVVGGPEPAVTDDKIFKKYPWMDIVVIMEGEYVFHQLLKHDFKNLETIPGILINQNGTAVKTEDAGRINDLEQLPSPYLNGMFDQLIADNPDHSWIATLETTRGCPYQCTFCDWGSLTYSKVKKYQLERIFDELEWIGQKCVYVSFTDANFGMFVDRDELIIEQLLAVQKKYKKITSYTMTWAKNQNKAVIQLAKKLNEESLFASQALTISLQSHDEQVLSTIKRKNLKSNKIQEIYEACDKNNVPVETELILGLPGDTGEKWKQNFYSLFELGNHMGITFHKAQILENAELNLTQKDQFGIKTATIYDYFSDNYTQDDIKENMQVVIATDLIPFEEMLQLWIWNNFIKAFHVSGLSVYIARFYNKNYLIDYKTFYENLYNYVTQDSWFVSEFNKTKELYLQWIQHGVIHTHQDHNTLHGWNLHLRLLMELHRQNKIAHLYKVLENFIQQTFESQYLQSLLAFQKHTMIEYHTLKHFPKTIDSDYDFYGYLVNDEPLNKAVSYTITTKEDPNMSETLFYDNFYFGRKRYFGNAVVSK